MAEEVKEQAVEEEVEQEGTGTDQNKTGRTFSQDDVNKLIAKEKAAWKRAHDKEKETLSGAETTLREQISARDEVIQKQVDLLKKDLELDEITIELLAEKDALEQFHTLVKIMEKRGKQDIPRTPRGEKGKPEFKSTFRPNV